MQSIMNMKEFVKWVLAVLCGLFVWGIVKALMFIMMIGSMASSSAAMASSGSTTVLPKEGVMLVDMSRTLLAEQSAGDDPMRFLQSGEMYDQVGILDAVNAIRKAAEDPAVKMILLKTDNASNVTYLEEFRKALTDFRKSGKAVVAYGEAFTSGSYYLASVADKIYSTSHHGGNVMMLGVSGRMMFLKDLLDRLGINYQLIRHGKYKSAGEMYIKNSASPENMEQNQEMVASIWETIGRETAESRGISKDSLDLFIDRLMLNLPEDLVAHGLVDELLDVEGYKAKIASLAGKDNYKDVKFFSLSEYVSAKVKENFSAKKKIAVIYADGSIVEEGTDNDIVGKRFAALLAQARADSTVKAVVFRVNSPGGTVLASGKIKEEVDLTRAVKPVIASYGSYAASGGYWISNSCDRIFSDATTLTGSIGVFAAVPEFSKTLKDVAHVNITPVNSHAHSDMFSLTRPFDTEETAWMQTSIEDIYTRFINTVAEGRDMTPEAVDEIAQGRVWTGSDALKIGLVDEIGTLSDAIAYAAQAAGDPDVSAWHVTAYPKKKSAFEQLFERMNKKGNEEEILAGIFAGTPFEATAKSFLRWQKTWSDGTPDAVFFARMPYEIEIR